MKIFNKVTIRGIITLAFVGAYLAQIFLKLPIDDKFYGILLGCFVWYGYTDSKAKTTTATSLEVK